jgi:endonuclease-8
MSSNEGPVDARAAAYACRMPEGDALRRAALRLRPLVGERVAASAPDPRGLRIARAVDGLVLESVDAVGKHLLLRFEGGIVVRSHLGMNGRWRIGPRDAPHRGRPWLVLRGLALEATQWNGTTLTLDDGKVRQLGPDLLAESTDIDALARRVAASDPTRLLGEALLDQRLVAGIGNMWLAELLWHTRLSPWLPVGRADVSMLAQGLRWARHEMERAVHGARPARSVYRRAGRACPRCGTVIRSRGLGEHNRIAYWCPSCQEPSPTLT